MQSKEKQKLKTGISRLQEEQQKSLNMTIQRIEQWKKFENDYHNLHSLLGNISDKLTYNVMVPFGKLAFAPGKLTNTNEVLVLLGDNWFIERSTKQAQGIVERRLKSCKETLDDLESEKYQSEGWIKHTQDTLGEGVKEIVEEYDPVRDKSWKDKRKSGKQPEDNKRAEDADLEMRVSRVRWEDQECNPIKVISFQHSGTSPPNTLQFQEGDKPQAVTSPSDIWQIFGSPTAEKKSILKPAKPLQPIATPAVSKTQLKENETPESPVQEVHLKEDDNQAFTGTIVETDPSLTAKTLTEVPKRPVSRFKAQRSKK